MILDSLGQAYRYAGLRAGFARAFAYLIATDIRALAPGRHPIDGERLYVGRIGLQCAGLALSVRLRYGGGTPGVEIEERHCADL